MNWYKKETKDTYVNKLCILLFFKFFGIIFFNFDFIYIFFLWIFFLIFKFLWDVTLPFWFIMRSGRWNAMTYIATKGTIFGRRRCGEFFYHESYYDDSVIMTIYEFQFCCDVSSGRGYALYGIWAGLPINRSLSPLHGFLGWLKNHTPYYYYQ
jgi:hypothetical protein